MENVLFSRCRHACWAGSLLIEMGIKDSYAWCGQHGNLAVYRWLKVNMSLITSWFDKMSLVMSKPVSRHANGACSEQIARARSGLSMRNSHMQIPRPCRFKRHYVLARPRLLCTCAVCVFIRQAFLSQVEIWINKAISLIHKERKNTGTGVYPVSNRTKIILPSFNVK